MKTPFKILLILLFSGYAFAGEETINGLEWKAGPLRVIRDINVGTYMIEMEGFYNQPGWKLYMGKYKVPIGPEGEFNLTIPIYLNRFIAPFHAEGPNGETENEPVHVDLNGFLLSKPKQKWLEKELRSVSLGAGIGTTFISYYQTDAPIVKETAVTPKYDLTYAIEPGVCSLESSGQIAVVGSKMNLFAVDARIGYELPVEQGSSALYLLGGFYYTTSFGTNVIGYGNVYGPEFFPAFRKVFSNRSSLAIYIKYSPVLNGFSILDLDNASLSGGISYYLKPFSAGMLKGIPLGLSFDASRVKLAVVSGESVTTSYTIAANLLF